MNSTVKLFLLIGIVFIVNILNSQEWITTNGGRMYYYGYPLEPPPINVSPPNPNETITGYNLISQIELDDFNNARDAIGDANNNGLNEIYIDRYNLGTGITDMTVYEFDENLNHIVTILEIGGMA